MGAKEVEEAAQRVAEVIVQTPLELSQRLSEELGREIYLKREDRQVCRSFKVRGAYNTMATLSPEARRAGVVCASAGNHAQGVAYACARLGIPGTIFLPSNTPKQKRQRIAAIGQSWVDQVIVEGNFDQANELAQARAHEQGQVYVHPYDGAATICGQGTLAPDLYEQCPTMGTLLVPVGGGGLIAGMAAWFKENAPDVTIIGVESEGAACAKAALDAGHPVTLPHVNTFVDGTAVGRIGDVTFELIRDLVDDVITVPEGAVCTEMLDLYHSEGIIAEPAGALASAAARRFLSEARPGPIVCVVSGGNNDLSRYADVIERSARYEGLRHYFLVTFPQEPGALRLFLDEILCAGEDIIHFEYTKKNNRDTGPALVGIELVHAADIEGLRARMKDSPLKVEEISPDSDYFSLLI
ncbi:MAG: threonine ammonia-lyase IlvA [Actinomycetaceae bacterium]|nr:threonine ammonia-lyase IlvA [Actinomycetaceae bacterium]